MGIVAHALPLPGNIEAVVPDCEGQRILVGVAAHGGHAGFQRDRAGADLLISLQFAAEDGKRVIAADSSGQSAVHVSLRHNNAHRAAIQGKAAGTGDAVVCVSADEVAQSRHGGKAASLDRQVSLYLDCIAAIGAAARHGDRAALQGQIHGVDGAGHRQGAVALDRHVAPGDQGALLCRRGHAAGHSVGALKHHCERKLAEFVGVADIRALEIVQGQRIRGPVIAPAVAGTGLFQRGLLRPVVEDGAKPASRGRHGQAATQGQRHEQREHYRISFHSGSFLSLGRSAYAAHTVRLT